MPCVDQLISLYARADKRTDVRVERMQTSRLTRGVYSTSEQGDVGPAQAVLQEREDIAQVRRSVQGATTSSTRTPFFLCVARTRHFDGELSSRISDHLRNSFCTKSRADRSIVLRLTRIGSTVAYRASS